MHTYPTKDIKLASCLIGLGIPYRQSDPVTCEVQSKDGREHKQYTFWLDIGDDYRERLCGLMVDAYLKAKPFFDSSRMDGEYTLEVEHPLYWMMGVLFNRETLVHWMRSNAEPMKIYKEGARTVLISARASQLTKDRIKRALQ